MNREFTLITGASHGIGKSMAFICAQKGMNLLLIALPDELLSQAAQEISEKHPEVDVHTYGIDLCQVDAPKKIFDWTQKNGFDVDILLNNAGLGDAGYFELIPWEKTLAIIQLNIQASVGMTHYFLPQMKERGKGIIMGTSSVAGIMMTPYKTTYSASKRFLYSFYLTLRQECKGSGVQVNVVCPPPTLTNEDILKRMDHQGKRAKMVTYTADEVASSAIKNMFKNRAVIIPGRFMHFLILFSWAIPHPLKLRILAKIYERDTIRYTDAEVPYQVEN
jgi:short-subunit dehydrogenase